MAALDRITQQPGMMAANPASGGMRVTVGMIVGQIGAGRTIEGILADHPYPEREDIFRRFATPHSSLKKGRST